MVIVDTVFQVFVINLDRSMPRFSQLRQNCLKTCLEFQELDFPFTRATAPATENSPQQLQGEFVISFHRLTPPTGSLGKRTLTTTPLHSFLICLENNKRSLNGCQEIDSFFKCIIHRETLFRMKLSGTGKD
jgi:hypothetical protein